MNSIRSGNHAQLERFLGHCDAAKVTPMIWGAYAIGKSTAVYRYAKRSAKRMGRELRVWHKISPQDRMRLFEDKAEREKAYVLYDNRAASNDSTDDKGIPDINNPNYLCWIQNQVYNVFSLEGAAGMLFNDEINLAPTLVQNSMYKMVYDRAVGDISFVDDIFIVCAGNRMEDRAFVQETPWPLRTRMLHFQLDMATADDQISHFIEIDIDPRLITFFKAHEDLMFHSKEDSGEFTASTPRTIELCSKTIKDLGYSKDADKEDVAILACGAMSTYVGDMFLKFMQATALVDISAILANPSKAQNIKDLDSQYGLVSLLVSRFNGSNKPEEIFGKIVEIYKHIPEEIGILLFRMLKGTKGYRFQKCVIAHPEVRTVLIGMAKYILTEAS